MEEGNRKSEKPVGSHVKHEDIGSGDRGTEILTEMKLQELL